MTGPDGLREDGTRAAALWDSHCHLQDPRLAGALPEVLARARAAGAAGLVCCATGEADWEPVLELARAHPGTAPRLAPMLGLHPWWADRAAPGWTGRLRGLLEATGAGVGECGLDFAPGRPERAVQEAVLEAQLRLAVELDRPVAIHCVRAWGALLDRLRSFGIPAAGALVHAFSGSAEVAEELQALGVHLSFGPAAVRAGAGRSAQALAAAAPDRLLFETDAPFGAPEPARVRDVARAAARLRGAPLEPLAAQAERSALGLFGRLAP